MRARNPVRALNVPNDWPIRAAPGAVRLLVAILAGCALAGCTTAGPATQGASTRATASATATATATATAKPPPSPRQRAIADANAIFASFAVPPGARKLASVPVLGGASGRMVLDLELPQTDVVDTGGWWAAPGGPRAVLGWEQAHVSKRFSQSDGFRVTVRGMPAITYDMFNLPAILGLLDNRYLIVQAVADGKQTLIRVDAESMWNPPRPASEVIPSAARVVTLSGVLPSGKPAGPPVTITDPGTVRQIIALTNGLPLSPFPPPTCLGYSGGLLMLTFRATAGGPALAVVTAQAAGCAGVSFAIGGKYLSPLGGPRATPTFGLQIMRIAGLHWKVAFPNYG